MNDIIKMIGLDLDGTVLTTDKKMTPYTREVLQKAIEAGVVVLPATGRPISAISKEFLDIPGVRYALTSNGARILDLDTGQVLVENMLPKEKAEQLLDLLFDYDAILEMFIDGRSYVRNREFQHVYDYYANPHMAEYMIHTRNPVDDLYRTLEEKGTGVDKVHCIFKHTEDKREAAARLKEVDGIVAASSFGPNIEINQEGTDKGQGLLQLGACLGIRREEIMACGDGMNDYEMLKAVGFAVAMENGHEKVREIADYITVSNDEDGVAKAIEKFVLHNRK